jgi:hypothetical protein
MRENRTPTTTIPMITIAKIQRFRRALPTRGGPRLEFGEVPVERSNSSVFGLVRRVLDVSHLVPS